MRERTEGSQAAASHVTLLQTPKGEESKNTKQQPKENGPARASVRPQVPPRLAGGLGTLSPDGARLSRQARSTRGRAVATSVACAEVAPLGSPQTALPEGLRPLRSLEEAGSQLESRLNWPISQMAPCSLQIPAGALSTQRSPPSRAGLGVRCCPALTGLCAEAAELASCQCEHEPVYPGSRGSPCREPVSGRVPTGKALLLYCDSQERLSFTKQLIHRD